VGSIRPTPTITEPKRPEQRFRLFDVVPVEGQPAAVLLDQRPEALDPDHARHQVPEDIAEHSACRAAGDHAG
jgi:hypothetical protein